MAAIKENISRLLQQLAHTNVKLIAVSKTQPVEAIREAFEAGLVKFGENKVQELVEKHEAWPESGIEWHLIGHLQRNKVKYIAPFVNTIQSIDSLKLLEEINKHGEKWNRLINGMLQIRIADEETKFGLSPQEAHDLLLEHPFRNFPYVRLTGVMGIATNTENEEKLRQEFRLLKNTFDKLKQDFFFADDDFFEISMGMSSDYLLAIEEGSTMIRVGSGIFGARNYTK